MISSRRADPHLRIVPLVRGLHVHHGDPAGPLDQQQIRHMQPNMGTIRTVQLQRLRSDRHHHRITIGEHDARQFEPTLVDDPSGASSPTNTTPSSADALCTNGTHAPEGRRPHHTRPLRWFVEHSGEAQSDPIDQEPSGA
jgi:hypothetical protein